MTTTRLQDLRYVLKTIGLSDEAKDVFIISEGIGMISQLVSLSEDDYFDIARENQNFSV